MKKTPTSDNLNSEIWTARGCRQKSHPCVYIPFPKEISSNVRSTQAAHVRGIWLLPSALSLTPKTAAETANCLKGIGPKIKVANISIAARDLVICGGISCPIISELCLFAFICSLSRVWVL
ncbi:hypothetical protein CDAR_200861 [Caerostris darwini]|uniref:Uncharacterized protein n=1 Tax=Caerostris darwini TaxID=1538125 RepID=A0AAV4Q447_9ARAC|nr:hypothetical protein CDAR_200861 [Caerostris darwini]